MHIQKSCKSDLTNMKNMYNELHEYDSSVQHYLKHLNLPEQDHHIKKPHVIMAQ